MKHLTRFAMINFLLIAVLVWGFSAFLPVGSKVKSLKEISDKNFILIPSPAAGLLTPSPAENLNKPSSTGGPQVNIPINSPIPVASSPSPVPAASLIDQVSRHNTQSDCWVTYEGGVYNITGFFGQHPGGDAVMALYCGKDITGPFNTMGKVSPKPHSQKARQMLESYRIQ